MSDEERQEEAEQQASAASDPAADSWDPAPAAAPAPPPPAAGPLATPAPPVREKQTSEERPPSSRASPSPPAVAPQPAASQSARAPAPAPAAAILQFDSMSRSSSAYGGSAAALQREKTEREFRDWQDQLATGAGVPSQLLETSFGMGPAPTASLVRRPAQTSPPRNEPAAAADTSMMYPGMSPIDHQTFLSALELERSAAVRRTEYALLQEDLARRKRKVLDDWEVREREWERERDDEMRWLRGKDLQLRTLAERLDDAEEQHAARVKEADEHFARKSEAVEEQRRRTTDLLEQRLRFELEQELLPALRKEREEELAPEVMKRVQEKLRADYQRMCDTMQEEVEGARARMREELTRAAEPRVEAALLPRVSARVEAEVQAETLGALRAASDAAQQLRAELQEVIEGRDAARHAAAEVADQHQRMVRTLADEVQMERRVAEQVRLELRAARDAAAALAAERKQYPLLETDVAQLPAAWLQGARELDSLRKERSRLTAELQFARQECAALGGPLGAAFSSEPCSIRLDAAAGGGAAGADGGSPSPLRDAASAGSGGGSAKQIPAPDRFRHPPNRLSDAPTFPLARDERERVFFKEMELLREQTERDRRRRQEAQSPGAGTPTARNAGSGRTPQRRAVRPVTPPSARRRN